MTIRWVHGCSPAADILRAPSRGGTIFPESVHLFTLPRFMTTGNPRFLFIISVCRLNPDLVDVVQLVRGGPRVAFGNWRPSLAGEMRPSRFVHWLATSYSQGDLARAMFIFSPRTTVARYPIFRSPGMVLTRQQIQQNKKQKRKKKRLSTQLRGGRMRAIDY